MHLKKFKNTLDVFMEQVWIKYLDPANKQKVLKAVETQYNAEQLKELAVKMSSLPKDKAFMRKITRLLNKG